jgi:hypothetical protein
MHSPGCIVDASEPASELATLVVPEAAASLEPETLGAPLLTVDPELVPDWPAPELPLAFMEELSPEVALPLLAVDCDPEPPLPDPLPCPLALTFDGLDVLLAHAQRKLLARTKWNGAPNFIVYPIGTRSEARPQKKNGNRRHVAFATPCETNAGTR